MTEHVVLNNNIVLNKKKFTECNKNILGGFIIFKTKTNGHRFGLSALKGEIERDRERERERGKKRAREGEKER